LYEVLGVRSDASTAEIRTAYRRAARRHHPDTGDGSTAAMSAATGAWQVLGDASARARYDASLRAGAATGSAVPRSTSTSTTSSPSPERVITYTTGDPARFPWRLMAVMATVGAVIVLLGSITAGPSEPSKPDNLLQPSSCVDLLDNGDAAEVACQGPHDGVVLLLVPFGSVCPTNTEAHRDRQGMGTACVVLADAATSG
jgi:molecular chaperone DnaJ